MSSRLARSAGSTVVRATLALCTLTLCSLAPAARAQRPQDPATDHAGFFIGFGFGPGRLAIDCGECGVPDAGGAFAGGTSGGFQFGMGGAVRPNVLLGGELTGWVTTGTGPRSAGVVNLAFVAQVYPRPRSGLFVRGGIGIGGAALEDETLGLVRDLALSSTGFSVKAGVGYDFRFGGGFGLAPFVDYVQLFAQGDEIVRNGQRYVGPPNPGSLQAGLSFNWY
jgi:hypothetical protein